MSSSRSAEAPGEGTRPTAGKAESAVSKSRKLTNKERAELEALPRKIEALEAEQTTLTAKLADPNFFKTAGAEVRTATARLQEVEAALAAAYARWGELEG